MAEAITRQLDLLAATGLLRLVASAPDLEYLFRHALVQDAAYASLLRQDRRRLHRAVGETLERLHAARLAEVAGELALHFETAGALDRARHYYALAGGAALTRAANREAEGYYRAALALTPPAAEEAALLRGLATALLWQGRLPEQIATGRAAVALYAAAGNSDAIARLYFEMTRGAFLGSDMHLLGTLIGEGRAALQGAPDTAGLSLFLSSVGVSQLVGRQLDHGRQTLFRALDLAAQFGETEAEIEILSTLVTHGDLPLAERQVLMEKAVALADPNRPSLGSSWAYNNLGILLREVHGRWQEAIPYHQTGRLIARRTGAAMGECWSYGAWADALLTGGDLAAVAALLPQVHEAVAQTGHSPLALGVAQRIQLQLARYQTGPAARPLLEQALAAGPGESTELLGRGVGPLLADLLLEMAQPVAVEALLVAQLALAEQQRHPTVGLRSLLATAYMQLGRAAEAAAALEAAARSAGPTPTPPESLALALAAARLALARGDGAAAATAFTTAHAGAAALNMRWQQARILWEWGRAGVAGAVPGTADAARAHLVAAHELFAAAPAPYYAAAARSDL